MRTVRFGVIGVGNMGLYHAQSMASIEHATLTAICDSSPDKLAAGAAKVPGAKTYTRYQELINSGEVDAVLVATPHYQHAEMTIAALDKGLHVLCEKPAAVTVKEARRMNEAAARHPELKFAMDFQMRMSPVLAKLREVIAAGEIGEITRMTWVATSWFRTWAYYASGGWRATWEGEGGGVLINQCPHNLDQLYWLSGMMPSRITAVAHIGKTHPIEVEDEVSAILEYPNGATGHFITSTGEAPGADRLEIAGDRGKILAEGGKLLFRRTRVGVKEFRESDPGMFAQPETWDIEIPVKPVSGELQRLVTQNFVNAIVKDEPLVVPGTDGVKGLEIGNAMIMSGITRKPVDLPLDGDAFDDFLKDMIKQYGGRKTLKTKDAVATNMSASFARSS